MHGIYSEFPRALSETVVLSDEEPFALSINAKQFKVSPFIVRLQAKLDYFIYDLKRHVSLSLYIYTYIYIYIYIYMCA